MSFSSGRRGIAENRTVLLARIPGAICAFPLESVVEIMRPLPMRALPDMPDFVRGVALIRGIPSPVIDMAALFQGAPGAPTRLVALRAGARTVGVLVERVSGIQRLCATEFHEMPALLRNARSEAVETMGSLDGELLACFDAGKLVPENAWAAVAGGESS